ncbi:hypothetical protein [Bacillus thuringiensis]|uniref:hypothetical protein n=1 Tax=Bacillus thuringiensis TaxID=1428 RepID=UPI002D7F813A|nr:hypothetical protein [Bacillus thuringiensis]MEB4819675.1 hypothetical protein [Bacillus thuringiensis]
MRKVDVVVSLVELEKIIFKALNPLEEAGLDSVFEIFSMLDFEDAANILLENAFKDVYLENIQHFRFGTENKEEFTNRLLKMKPELSWLISQDETLKVVSVLLDIEKERHEIYITFANLGVEFDIPEAMGRVHNFIIELVGCNVGDGIYGYNDEKLTKQEVLDLISDKLKQKSE